MAPIRLAMLPTLLTREPPKLRPCGACIPPDGLDDPEHAFSETDRLLARAAEAGKSDRINTASSCWRNWNREDATAHDGTVRAGHPAVRVLHREHSNSSHAKPPLIAWSTLLL
jgi:hypothetical protein